MTDKQKERKKDDYYFHKEHHICTRCGKYRAKPGGTLCEVCSVKNYDRLLKYRENLSEEQRVEQDKKHSEWAKERRRKWAEEGICTECGKRPAVSGHKLCVECKTRTLNKYRRNNKEYRRTMGTCAYCDEPRVYGKRTCEKHYAILRATAEKMNQSEGAKKNQKEYAKRVNLFWREMEWEKKQKA